MGNKMFLSIVLLGFLACPAYATPTKIMRIPSTDSQPYGTFHISIENNTTMFRQVSIGGHAEPVIIGITAGMLDAGTFMVEAGVDMREPTDTPLSFNAKISTTEQAFGKWGPTLAVGIYDFGTDHGVNDYNIVYGEASKTVSFIGRITVGYFIGNSYFLKSVKGETDSRGLMVGFDRRMPEVNEKLWFGIDYMATKSYYGAVSAGFGWTFSEKSAMVFGYTRYNEEAVATGFNPVTGNPNPGTGANVMTWQAHFDF